jgi:protein-S-isoprenylcysteine O-methyltransferase Ste14
MNKSLSFILPSTLLIGIVVTGIFKIANTGAFWSSLKFNFDIAVISICVLWLIYEIWVSRHDIRKDKKVSDYGTREFYGFSQSMTMLTALWVNPVWDRPSICHIIGFFLIISGIIFRIWAIQTLGQYYSHIVRKIDQHQIIATGPYKHLRHPSYAGMIIALAGIVLFYFNFVTVIIFICLLLPAIILRIKIEEKILFTINGYVAFAESRRRIIPYIW